MTRLTFTGERGGREISITWTDGDLAGDRDTVEWIQQIARMAEASGTIVGGIGGPYSTSHHLANPYVAAEIIRSMFPGDVRQEGLLPPRVAPPGAIQ
jgi:hypothetical protein